METRDPGQYIKDLIESGESQHLDFKFEISDARKMARTFSSFANTHGGRLLIGVKDNGKVAGVRTEEEAYMAESAAHVFCRPPVNYRLKKWIVDGKCILEVEIPPSPSRPHFAKDESGGWIAYVRVKDQNIRANRILLGVWKSERSTKGRVLNFRKEEKILLDFLTENDRITLQGFIRIARISSADAEKILISLILMDVLITEVTEKTVFFRLRKTTS